MNLSKVLHRFGFSVPAFFHWRSVPCTKFFPLFYQGMHCPSWVSSRSIGGFFWLVRCPPNLRVAFNKILSKVQDREAACQSAAYKPKTNPPPARKKTGVKNLGHGTERQWKKGGGAVFQKPHQNRSPLNISCSFFSLIDSATPQLSLVTRFF